MIIYFINKLIILIIGIPNKFGRGLIIRKKIFSSKNILEKNFQEKKKFSFVQIGANDGVSFDFLHDFVVKRNSIGIVIEPIKDYFEELKNNYRDFPNIIKINKAVHPNEKSIVMNRISPEAFHKYPDWVKGIASVNHDYHHKTNIDSADMKLETVEADSLINIVKDNYKESHLDYIQVDAEGFDYQVIKSFDFNYLKPNMIKYESVNLNYKDQKDLELLLKSNGYFLFKESSDMIGIKLSKVKLF